MDETRHLIERARRVAEEAQRVAAETKQLVRSSRELQQWTARVQSGGADAGYISFNHFSNRLLSLLPPAEFARLAPLLQGVVLTTKQILHHTQTVFEYVYFPIGGLLSAMIVMQDGDTIGVSTIGNDGMAGLSAFNGDGYSPHDLVVQIPGNALRMDVEKFQSEANRGGLLYDVLKSYHGACAMQSAYDIACNGLHSVGQRCCRQLLCIHDRIATDLLPLTHESLAAMLGVRRASVTEELNSLQSRGIIDTQRGRIQLEDCPRLETLACECYGAIKQEFARLFDSNGIGHLHGHGSASGLSNSRRRTLPEEE
ncbi:MAG TPA: Crp/Fnr family transcriptional regulator [Pirellulales bacterium]|jgi:CRP-like cAMP-binding protein